MFFSQKHTFCWTRRYLLLFKVDKIFILNGCDLQIMALTFRSPWLWLWPSDFHDYDFDLQITLTMTLTFRFPCLWLWLSDFLDYDFDFHITLTMTLTFRLTWLWLWISDWFDYDFNFQIILTMALAFSSPWLWLWPSDHLGAWQSVEFPSLPHRHCIARETFQTSPHRIRPSLYQLKVIWKIPPLNCEKKTDPSWPLSFTRSFCSLDYCKCGLDLDLFETDKEISAWLKIIFTHIRSKMKMIQITWIELVSRKSGSSMSAIHIACCRFCIRFIMFWII